MRLKNYSYECGILFCVSETRVTTSGRLRAVSVLVPAPFLSLPWRVDFLKTEIRQARFAKIQFSSSSSSLPPSLPPSLLLIIVLTNLGVSPLNLWKDTFVCKDLDGVPI